MFSGHGWRSLCVQRLSTERLMPVGVIVINVSLNCGNLVKVDILVTYEKPLQCDLLIGMDTIKEIGGVQITLLGTV